MTIQDVLDLRILASTEKFFPDELPLAGPEQIKLTGLADERLSWHVVCRSKVNWPRYFQVHAAVETFVDGAWVEAELPPSALELYEIKFTPAGFTALPEPYRDSNYLDTERAAYPDLLVPLEQEAAYLHLVPGKWHGIRVEFNHDRQVPAGIYRVRLTYTAAEAEDYVEGELSIAQELEILEAKLAPLTTWHTEWFHADCIADYYGLDVWSEEHWQAIEAQVKMAVDHDINLLLTPLFTPPLDTEEGGERTTVQLLKVKETGDLTWEFDFSRFERWVEMAKRCGVAGFEINHFFTQWGARSAPKIMVKKDGKLIRRFFWDTKADSEEYSAFLHQFLDALMPELEKLGIKDQTFFHISDEPNKDHLESYRAALNVVKDQLKDVKRIDALSDFDFYHENLVQYPIPANNHIEPFLDAKIEDLWTYYCTSQAKDVSNRFFAMPGARTRILGVQLFKYDIVGFLHWGYNFYNSQYSRHGIDPFKVSDAAGAFHAGDPYLVYPGKDCKPLPSLRLKLMAEAFQDLRALQVLAEKTSKEDVMELVEGSLAEPLTFSHYPMTADYLLGLRLKVNEALRKA